MLKRLCLLFDLIAGESRERQLRARRARSWRVRDLVRLLFPSESGTAAEAGFKHWLRCRRLLSDPNADQSELAAERSIGPRLAGGFKAKFAR